MYMGGRYTSLARPATDRSSSPNLRRIDETDETETASSALRLGGDGERTESGVPFEKTPAGAGRVRVNPIYICKCIYIYVYLSG